LAVRDEAGAAFQRYQAMYGLLSNVPDAVDRQAERDRAAYGSAYIWIGKDGEKSFHHLMAVRFMVEVCGIPLREAWAAACEDLENVVQENLPDAKAMALQLFRSQGNVLRARELARFMRDVYKDRYWRDVIDELESAALVPENSGLENWT
jgi:hypothetical protein